MLRMTAMAGWNSTVLSSWKLETSRTDQVSSVLSSISETTGTPMLPPTSVGRPASFKNLAQQRGGGGLAVGAGDGQRVALEEAGGQFKLADDRQAEALHLRQFGCVQRHAGADDDQVLAKRHMVRGRRPPACSPSAART